MLTGEGRVGFQGGAGFILCSVKLVVARLLTDIRSLESSAAPVRSNFFPVCIIQSKLQPTIR